jgi:phage terminase large subunit
MLKFQRDAIRDNLTPEEIAKAEAVLAKKPNKERKKLPFVPFRMLKETGWTRAQVDHFITPVGFAEMKLKMTLYTKQKEALDAFQPIGCQVSLASANGGGKSSRVLVAAILWHLSMFPKGRFACTSGKYSQIEEQIMPALWAYKQMFPDWKWFDSPYIETEEGGFFTGFSTKKPGYAEGFHDDGEDVPLAFVVDEAKSCEPWLEGVVEGRIHPTRLMLMSSHGFAEGWFYDSQTRRKNDFACIQQKASDCPHLTQQYISDVRRKWGQTGLADSILGEGFMRLVEDAVIDYKQYDYLVDNPPKPAHGEIHAFCDFAWSSDGDESVLAMRNGNIITLEACFRAEGLHAVCDRFVYEFKRLNLQAWQISGDEGGGGQLVMDELDRRGWHLQRWNNGAPANDADHFQDSKAEVMYNFSELVDMKSLVLPKDDDLRFQLISRKRKMGTKGRLAIETKAEMKERGVFSPDRADAVVAAAMPKGGWASGATFNAKPMTVGNWQPMGG